MTRGRYAIGSIVVCVALAGCGGSSGSSSASPSLDLTMRPIATCPASANLPPDLSIVEPAAKNAPTSVLRVGDATGFTAPTGSKVTALGKSARTNIVCQSARGTGAGRLAVIFARRPGFVQIGLVNPGSTTVLRTLVTITP